MHTKALFKAMQAMPETHRSENLLAWVRKQAHRGDYPLFVAFNQGCNVIGVTIEYDQAQTQCGQLYLGIGHLDQGWMHGSRLSEILRNGSKAETWAYPSAKRFIAIDNWFKNYLAQGLCWLDPEHYLYGHRWDTGEESRTCTSCGYRELKVVEMVVSWVAASAA